MFSGTSLFNIRYSTDGGDTFQTFPLGPYINGKSIRIQNIITEPSGTSQFVVLFGQIKDGSTINSISIQLDFTKIWSRQCIDSQDPARSDFELWSPGNSTTSQSCTLGAQRSYTRLKSGRQCYVGKPFTDLAVNLNPCECTQSDFECDPWHKLQGNKCVLRDNVVLEAKCINGIERKPTGYVKRKISMCKGGLELDIDTNVKPCGIFCLTCRQFTIIYVVILCWHSTYGRLLLHAVLVSKRWSRSLW
jgi:hypothetical protein